MYNEMVMLGIVFSLGYYELTLLSPGGLIVPGYMALCLTQPLRIVYTLGIALLTWGLMRLLSHFLILYGRRRFALAVLLSFLLSAGISALGVLPFQTNLIASLAPGLMVRDMERQGLWKTLASLAIVTGLLALVMLWMGWL